MFSGNSALCAANPQRRAGLFKRSDGQVQVFLRWYVPGSAVSSAFWCMVATAFSTAHLQVRHSCEMLRIVRCGDGAIRTPVRPVLSLELIEEVIDQQESNGLSRLAFRRASFGFLPEPHQIGESGSEGSLEGVSKLAPLSEDVSAPF